MAQTGWMTLTTCSDDATVGSVAWTNPTNAQADDGVSATCAMGLSQSHYIKGLQLVSPEAGLTGATILGIEVRMRRHFTNANVTDTSIRLVKGGVIGTTNRSAGTSWESGTSSYSTPVGSPSDLWGDTWTATDILSSTFGFVVSGTGLVSNSTGNMDSMQIRITYTPSGNYDNTGWLNLTTYTDDASVGSVAWTNPTFAATEDGSESSISSISSLQTHYLKGLQLVSLPSLTGRTILGIEVQIKREQASGSCTDTVVKLVKGGVVSGNNNATATNWPNTAGLYDVFEDHGSASDLWGLTWTPTDLASSTFGVVLSATANSSRIAVDVIQVRITHAPPASPTTGNFFQLLI